MKDIILSTSFLVMLGNSEENTIDSNKPYFYAFYNGNEKRINEKIIPDFYITNYRLSL